MTTIYNIDIVGNITNNNGVLSGFSENDYAKLPGVFTHNSFPWEIQFKVTTGNDVSTQGCICEQYYEGSTDYYHGLAIYIQNGTLRVRGGNGSSTFWRANTSYSFSTNSTYYVKIQFTGTQYIASVSTDGTTWTTADSINSSIIMTDSNTMHIGRRNQTNATGTSPWLGSIDLNECYIKVNNVYLWKGVTEVQPLTSNYKLVKVTERKYYKYNTPMPITAYGNPNITDGIVSSINSSNYIKINIPSTVDVVIKYGTSGASGYHESIFADGANNANYCVFINSDRQVWFYPQGNGQYLGYTFPANSYFFMRVQYLTGKIRFSFKDSTSSETVAQALSDTTNWYTTDVTISNNLSNKTWNIGNTPANNWTWGGTVDLNNSFYDIVRGTSSNYDYYEDVVVYKAIKVVTGKKYYKYKEVATGYRELESLTNARFNTGVQCTTQTSFEYEAAKTDNENWKYALENAYSSNYEWFISGYEDGYLEMHYKRVVYHSNINPVINTYYKIYGDFSTSTKRYYIDDVQQFTISDNSTGNLGGNIWYSGNGWRCKTLKLYDSGLNVIGEFHPCERMSDNTVGWYDVVSDTFITPSVTPSEIGDYATEPGTAQDYDFYEDVYSYKAIKKAEVEPTPTPTGVKLMSRDPSNPTSYIIDTEYPFDGSTYSAQTVGNYAYQLKILFDQSDNVESITYTTDFSASGNHPGYYDNSGNWHEISLNSGTIFISGLNDYDYSRGIIFGRSFSGTYTTS